MLIYISRFIGDYFKEKSVALSAALSEANDENENYRQEADALNLKNQELHSINEQLNNDKNFCQNKVIELQSQYQE